jgi:hypothetical protein
MAFLVFIINAAEADFLVRDLFDDLPTGTLPEGWTVVGEESGVKVVEEPSATNKSLLIEGIGAGVHVRRAFEPQTGVFTIEVRFMPQVMTGGNYGLPYVEEQDVALGGPVGAVCILHRNGGIDYYNDGWVNFTTIEEGTWYEIKIVTSNDSKTYDLYFNGDEIVTGAAHRNEYESLGELLFGPGVAHTGGNKFLYDYVLVYEGTEKPDTVTSVSASGKLTETWGEIKLKH